jgi:mannose-1-phosphate guanylyltransferase
MLYAVIVAGGQGTRLWPVSRRDNPKQIKPFVGGRTMLQKTYERVSKIVSPERVWVATNVAYQDEFIAQLPELSTGQMILEPIKRNTAAAVGLAAAILAKYDADVTMINVWSDHFIRFEEEYIKKILQAEKVLEEHPDYLIDIVAEPEYPATGFGYLEADGELATIDGETVYKAARFVEKPDLKTAQEYLAAGNFYWNTAIFVWKVKTLLSLYEKFLPEMYVGLMKIQSVWGTPEQEQVLNEVFPTLEAVAIDYAIFEKTDKIALIPAELGWRDVGSWQAIYDILTEAKDGVVQKGKVMAVDSKDTLIFNENEGKLVAVVGVKDLVIVDTKDSLLVMQKSQDQDIKKIITQMEETGEVERL